MSDAADTLLAVTIAPPDSMHGAGAQATVKPPESAAAREVLHRVFGYDSFRGQQGVVVDSVVAGSDPVPERLFALVEAAESPPLSGYLHRQAATLSC